MRGIDVVKSLYDAYAKRDIQAALDHCSDDVCFRWIAEPEQSRYAGMCMGKPEFLSRLMALDADFEYRSFVPVDFVDGGDRVAVQCELHLTSKATRKDLVMRTANFWTVRDGKVVEMVEFYDTALAASVL